MLFCFAPAYAKLSEKLTVKVYIPYSEKIIKKNINKERAKLLAKVMIIKKFINYSSNLTNDIKKNHKNYILNLIYKFNKSKYELINFKMEKSFKKNNSFIYVFSSKIKIDKNGQRIEIWNFLNNLIKNKKIDPLLSLELGLTYPEKLNFLTILRNWKKKHNGGILYIVTDNLISNFKLFKFLDKEFQEEHFKNSNLDQLIYLYDFAPLNLDICIKTSNVLYKKKYHTLSQKLLSSCKSLQSKKATQIIKKKLNDEIYVLQGLNVRIEKNDLIYKIINYRGYLPLKIPSLQNSNDIDQLSLLFSNFEEKPSINFLKKIRDELRLKKFNLIPNYITTQIGVSQNANYKY